MLITEVNNSTKNHFKGAFIVEFNKLSQDQQHMLCNDIITKKQIILKLTDQGYSANNNFRISFSKVCSSNYPYHIVPGAILAFKSPYFMKIVNNHTPLYSSTWFDVLTRSKSESLSNPPTLPALITLKLITSKNNHLGKMTHFYFQSDVFYSYDALISDIMVYDNSQHDLTSIVVRGYDQNHQLICACNVETRYNDNGHKQSIAAIEPYLTCSNHNNFEGNFSQAISFDAVVGKIFTISPSTIRNKSKYISTISQHTKNGLACVKTAYVKDNKYPNLINKIYILDHNFVEDIDLVNINKLESNR